MGLYMAHYPVTVLSRYYKTIPQLDLAFVCRALYGKGT